MSEHHLANVFASIDNRIQFIHHRVMQIFNDNKDYIYHHRKNAYKIIAHQLKITIEKLEKIIQEIKEIYIEHGFAKQCLDGSIIDMSRLENSNS